MLAAATTSLTVTASTAAMTGIQLGEKVTIDTTGMLVTATEGEAAEVVYIEDTAAGGTVHVRF